MKRYFLIIIFLTAALLPLSAQTKCKTASLVPSAIRAEQSGEMIVSVSQTGLDGKSSLATYRYNPADGSFVASSDRADRNESSLPAGVKVPAKLDSLVCPPALVKTADGRQRLIIPGFRTGFLYYADSPDEGKSWGLPHRMIHNPDLPFCACNLPDGDVLLVKNCRIDEIEFTKDDEIYACWSHNAGETWYKTLRVAAGKFCSTPVCCGDAEGNIYIAYKHYYQKVCKVELVKLSTDDTVTKLGTLVAEDAAAAFEKTFGGVLQKKTDWLDDPVKVCTYNTLRSTFGGGENWKQRCKTIQEHIKIWDPDIIGMQETSMSDLADLNKTLKKTYDYIAVTPEIMGPSVSKYRSTSEIPLLWRTERFSLVDKGWIEFNIINEIKCGANVSTESWANGADGNKAAIWAILLDKKTGQEICIFNLHLPTRTDPSKLGTARMVGAEVAKVAKGRPVFITGDYNADENTYAYVYLRKYLGYLEDGGLATPSEKRENWSYDSGYGKQPLEKKKQSNRHIDHVLFTPSNARPLSWHQQINFGSNGFGGSDHHPVMVVFQYAK